MKTQIIKIIPCLLAGFILSACVGAVNLPAGTIAEAKTEKTESETQTPEKLVIKELETQDKKVVEPVEPKPIISVEPKPVSANPCIANPFGNACSVEFDFIRELACRHESDSERCAPTIMRICNANPFDSFCNANFNNAREIACASEPNSERCTPTTTRVCDEDSLNTLCKELEAYYPAQYRACKNKPNSDLCAITTARICDANPLDTFCTLLTAYFPAQKQACAEGAYYGCGPTIARVCGADVFVYLDDLCRERRHTQRYDICLGEKNSERCAPIIVRVCESNSLDVLCDGFATYFPAQKEACKDRVYDGKCAPTIARVCGESPFDALCYGLTRYFSKYQSVRQTTCFGEENSERCARTIKRACNADILHRLCTQAEAYFPAQYAACEAYSYNLYDFHSPCRPLLEKVCSANANPFDKLCYGTNRYGVTPYDSERKKACQTERDSERCEPTIVRVCEANSLDYLCRGLATYFPAQKEACKDRVYDRHCNQTIARVCGENPLDSFCRLQVDYFPAQKLACESEPNSDRCAITMARVCADDQGDPFGVACQSVNLTGTSIPARPSQGRFAFTSDSTPSVNCELAYSSYYFYACTANVPSVINIKPLNDTNTGMATYTGQISVKYATLGGRPRGLVLDGRNYTTSLTKNIDIIADFDNNTLTYSGNLTPSFNFGGLEILRQDNPVNTININGNFTDRGILTGTVSFISSEASLIGLIGQDEAIGVFSRVDHGINSSFAGGFTATRQEPEPETTPNQ